PPAYTRLVYITCNYILCLPCYLDHRYLHSFPTRRSSDLRVRGPRRPPIDLIVQDVANSLLEPTPRLARLSAQYIYFGWRRHSTSDSAGHAAQIQHGTAGSATASSWIIHHAADGANIRKEPAVSSLAHRGFTHLGMDV